MPIDLLKNNLIPSLKGEQKIYGSSNRLILSQSSGFYKRQFMNRAIMIRILLEGGCIWLFWLPMMMAY